jgi:hypothetical protein
VVAAAKIKFGMNKVKRKDMIKIRKEFITIKNKPFSGKEMVLRIGRINTSKRV